MRTLNQANELSRTRRGYHFARDYLDMFIDRLTDAMGIPSTKGLT
jgi:hypothetical protein